MALTVEQKVGHLLRRFGLGASPQEMAIYVPLGVEGTLRKLIDFESKPDLTHPFRFCFRQNEDAEPGAYRTRAFWMLQFLTTTTPMREKLALFWHDHFAVDHENGGDGLMMLEYLRLLREDPAQPFPQLLEKMAKCPAFMEMLTMKDSTRAKPNENFARELLELYTLGEGHYTEFDIKEAARAFTGWSYENRYWQVDATHATRLRLLNKHGMWPSGYCFVPAFCDDGEKTVLGQKRNFTGEQLLKMVSSTDRCAQFISGKLWEFFAGTVAPKAVLDALVGEYKKTNGSVRALLYTIGRRPEFYEPPVFRKRIKSPVEFCVGIARAFGADSILPKMVEPEAAFDKPLSKEAWDTIGGLQWNSEQMGQELLFPPSVAGWDWGNGWISSNTMVWRMKFSGFQTWEPKDKERKKWGAGPGGQVLVEYVKSRQPGNVDALTHTLLRFFDVTLGAEAFETLKKKLEDRGGMQPLQTKNDEWLFGQLWNAYELLRAAPEFQMN